MKACQNERLSLSGTDIFLFPLRKSGNLRVLLIWCKLRHEPSNAVLELAIFAGVDERVDTDICEQQNHGEVVEPDDEGDNVAQVR